MSKSVLIVDDEPNIVASLSFVMKQAGFAVRAAVDGKEALASVREAAPDLMILDVMMPKLDGFQVCSEVRSNSEWGSVRILMLTAKGRDSEREKGLALGADAYMTKPFSTRDILKKAKELLGIDQEAK